RVVVALTYIFGIGPASARKILQMTGVNPDVRGKNLSEEDSGRLRSVIEREFKVEGALRTEVAMNIKRLMDIGAYGGLRHRRGHPSAPGSRPRNRGHQGCPPHTAQRLPAAQAPARLGGSNGCLS